MQSVTVAILCAFVAQGLAKESLPKGSVDKLADQVIDKLVDRLFGSLQTRAQTPFQRPTSSYSIASLPGGPLKDLAIKKIKASNGCRARDVSGKAAGPSFWDASAPMDPEKLKAMPGVAPPLGFFDPLGISARVPEGKLLFYREAELKHGRVCMAAVLGLLAADTHTFIPLVGEGVPDDTTALNVLSETRVGMLWPTIVAALGFFETLWANSDQRATGADYGFDPLGFKPKDEAGAKELQTKELLNGRLAMISVIGILAQEAVTGKTVLR